MKVELKLGFLASTVVMQAYIANTEHCIAKCVEDVTYLVRHLNVYPGMRQLRLMMRLTTGFLHPLGLILPF